MWETKGEDGLRNRTSLHFAPFLSPPFFFSFFSSPFILRVSRSRRRRVCGFCQWVCWICESHTRDLFVSVDPRFITRPVYYRPPLQWVVPFGSEPTLTRWEGTVPSVNGKTDFTGGVGGLAKSDDQRSLRLRSWGKVGEVLPGWRYTGAAAWTT